MNKKEEHTSHLQAASLVGKMIEGVKYILNPASGVAPKMSEPGLALFFYSLPVLVRNTNKGAVHIVGLPLAHFFQRFMSWADLCRQARIGFPKEGKGAREAYNLTRSEVFWPGGASAYLASETRLGFGVCAEDSLGRKLTAMDVAKWGMPLAFRNATHDLFPVVMDGDEELGRSVFINPMYTPDRMGMTLEQLNPARPDAEVLQTECFEALDGAPSCGDEVWIPEDEFFRSYALSPISVPISAPLFSLKSGTTLIDSAPRAASRFRVGHLLRLCSEPKDYQKEETPAPQETAEPEGDSGEEFAGDTIPHEEAQVTLG